LSPIRKLLLSTQCEDETLSDRQHRTISNRETRFSPVGTSRLTRTDGFLLFPKNGIMGNLRPILSGGQSTENPTLRASPLSRFARKVHQHSDQPDHCCQQPGATLFCIRYT
jgi:hypothetical protein